MCNFDRKFSFNSYSLNFSLNLTKTLIFKSQKPDLSDCERATSVDQVHIKRARALQSSITSFRYIFYIDYIGRFYNYVII